MMSSRFEAGGQPAIKSSAGSNHARGETPVFGERPESLPRDGIEILLVIEERGIPRLSGKLRILKVEREGKDGLHSLPLISSPI